MINILLWLGAVLWILLFIQLILNRALAPDLSRTELKAVKNPLLVSIIVPARNEERSNSRSGCLLLHTRLPSL
jgi:hypothetical protein